MKIITLVENTSVSPQYKSKHGLSFYIETKNHKILLDVGTDSLFLENAKLMGVDIEAVDTVIISHGHKDHGGALKLLLENNSKAKVYLQRTAFLPYYIKVLGVQLSIGLDSSLKESDQIVFTDDKYIIDDELQLFSNVTEREFHSKSNDVLYAKTENGYVQDSFGHEQSLIITEDGKSVLFSACAHCGIVNIINKAESILGSHLDYAVSGFHLYNPTTKKFESNELISQIGHNLNSRQTKFYTCHCTGEKAFTLLSNIMKDKINSLSTGSTLVL